MKNNLCFIVFIIEPTIAHESRHVTVLTKQFQFNLRGDSQKGQK